MLENASLRIQNVKGDPPACLQNWYLFIKWYDSRRSRQRGRQNKDECLLSLMIFIRSLRSEGERGEQGGGGILKTRGEHKGKGEEKHSEAGGDPKKASMSAIIKTKTNAQNPRSSQCFLQIVINFKKWWCTSNVKYLCSPTFLNHCVCLWDPWATVPIQRNWNSIKWESRRGADHAFYQKWVSSTRFLKMNTFLRVLANLAWETENFKHTFLSASRKT